MKSNNEIRLPGVKGDIRRYVTYEDTFEIKLEFPIDVWPDLFEQVYKNKAKIMEVFDNMEVHLWSDGKNGMTIKKKGYYRNVLGI